MASNDDINAKLFEPFPAQLIEEKQGLSYIATQFIRQRIIHATGNQFDWVIQTVDYREDGAIKERKDRNSGEILGVPTICVVTGTLTIPGLGSRSGVGTQVIEFGAGEDAAYKGAESDAFKRAAMAFGVGLQQLYIDTHKFKNGNNPPRQPSNEGTPVTMETHPYQPKWHPGAKEQNANGAHANGPSEKQLKRLFAMTRQLGLSNDEAKKELWDAYGVNSSTELTRTQYGEYTDELQRRIDAKGNDNDAPF